jgi:uncharacterized protein involved in oxidation of intracellular sulfur
MTFLLILNHKPYDGSDVVWNALRMADSARENGFDVKIFIMNEAVDLARETSVENAEFDLGKMLINLQKKGVQIKLCTTCINRCGINRNALLDKTWPASMNDLVSWISESDKIITF